MAMFMTKVWGANSPSGPLQFNEPARRASAIRALQNGGDVLLVGTKGPPTAPQFQGRVLGVMRPSLEPVMTLDYPIIPRTEDYENGQYRWPVALANLEAWSIPSLPKFSSLIPRKFYQDAATGIVPLTPAEEAIIRALVWEPVPLLPMTAAAQERLGIQRPYSPPPSDGKRRGVMHMRRAPAHTYAFALIGARQSSFKIGWAFDYEIRRRQFNKASLSKLGGIEYGAERHHRWDTAAQAYRMEQLVLKKFAGKRHSGNHEVIVGVRPDELLSVWTDCVLETRRPITRP